ncbi:MAG: tripartite tricarboxylate transporter substrate binding protein [Burkholderiales bacterium]|nr:MAG: tripartite tricarboxylate transporter substrate binding protein [Burkholderiales bacterium]
MTLTRRTAIRRGLLRSTAATLAAAALPGPSRAQQDWPSRPIRFVTGDAAGGPLDTRLRELLTPVAARLGAQTIVDNKPGAASQISHQFIVTQPADGYTVLLANATMAIFPTLYRKLPYSPLRDFTPVAFGGLSPIGLAIPASHPARTYAEWTAWARTQKGKLNYGSVGNGAVGHLYGFQLGEELGLEATHVPYKTVAQFLPDLGAGIVHFAMLDLLSLRAFMQKGDLRVLAITGDERAPFVADIPTFAELGLRGYDRMGWSAYYVRAGTPQPIVERLSAAINEVNATPEWTARRLGLWSLWKPLTPDALRQRIVADTEAWGALIRKTGVYAD